uniref:Uncharacterized protein n=1 Tax=Anguilla anguilla TaxID=7936 RepID=A0A0E9TDS0_ANGAN
MQSLIRSRTLVLTKAEICTQFVYIWVRFYPN